MQLLFGVLGDVDRGAAVFRQLVRASSDSNPGINPSTVTDKSIQLGHVSRTFAVWHEIEADRSFYLDGEIRVIDGEETTDRGTSERELAQVARLYDVHGAGIWARLDGSFCLMIRDVRDFQVGVDVGGTRGFYWWIHEGLVAFHTHLLDLAPAFPGTLTEDAGALGNFLECGQYPPGNTAYQQVHHVGAGRFLTLVDGDVRTSVHFRLDFVDAGNARPTARLIDDLIELLELSIGRCWRNASNPVVPLSGGMDSRYIAAELVRRAGDPALVQTITWGEDRPRVGSDAVIAGQVAARLGVSNTWFEKQQHHSTGAFERAIYLSSGEADCAIHFPDDHLLHAELAAPGGFSSLFRGDECFSQDQRLITKRAVLAISHARLSFDRGYSGLVDPELLERMVREQAALLDAAIADLKSTTPDGRGDEIYYEFRMSRVLAPYNTVKHADLEVYVPYVDRQLLEWIKGVPDHLRVREELRQKALCRRFPDVAAIPYASRSDHNLPDWRLRWSSDPTVARFFHSWCSRPGWLDTLGTKPQILAALEALETAAVAGTFAREPDRFGLGAHAEWRQVAKKAFPGRLLRELTYERRYARNNLPLYLRLARLAVLHGLLGGVESRRAVRGGAYHT